MDMEDEDMEGIVSLQRERRRKQRCLRDLERGKHRRAPPRSLRSHV